MDNIEYTETTIKSENVYDGKILNLRVDSVELPNRKYSKREIVEHNDVVAIIGISNKRMVVLKHFRKPAEEILIEIPAGIVEKGETPIDAAKREFLEETGYVAKNLTYIFMGYTTPGYSTEKIHFFLANEIEKSDIERDDESIEAFEMDLDEMNGKIQNLEIKDIKTMLAYFIATEYLNENN
ncbi:MAG: NUDIX hydrolase [Ezakiella sp.]|nr:NUDIX hydrolase [Ezakiella sp.]MDD7471879.1 NUDIX hydrolase [Bacillota bacterium]MDY3923843.1 NUDIX hydrolase [Ezakiella sp.]